KTAAKLLQEFGTLDNILANIEKVPGAKKQESLRAADQTILLGRQLVKLVTDVPMEFNWDQWPLQSWDAPRLLALFQEWGFRGLAEQVRRLSSDNRDPIAVSASPPELDSPALVQGELFPFGANVEDAAATNDNQHADANTAHTYHLIDTA